MALTIDKIKNINIPINVSRKPDNYPPSTRGISLYNDSVNLYDAISLFMASAPPATFNIGEGLLGNGSVLSPLSWAGVNHTAALSGNGSVGSPLDIANKGITLSKLAQSGATLNQIIKWDGTNWVPSNETGGATSFVPLSRELTINGVTYDLSQNRSWTIGSTAYPSAGIPVSTGSAWGTSIVNNSTNWNTAFSWGNHALAGYLTSYTETDPTVPSHVKAITTTNISNWNTAFGWGNHATQGYLTSAAIGSTVQPYNANTVIDGSYVHTDNNYTTAEKSKLAGIQAGAEVNVNADWNAVSGDAQILNKPTIPLVDTVPTSGSTNAVSSGSVFTALSFKADLVGGKVPAIQLPSYVDDVLEGYYNGTSFFIDSGFSTIMTPETGKIYINLLNNTSYRYTGSVYVQISNTVSSLNDLTDVTIGTLNNGQILQYNGTTSQWENISVTIGSGDMQKSVYDIDNDGVVDYAETIAVDVRNNSSSDTLYRGTIVYLSGSTGTHPNAVKAQANSEATSSGTFGVVINDISPNSSGLVAAMGTLHNLDTRTGANGNPNPFTSDTLLDGDVLWLDPNTAGYVTKTKPSAPNHAVFIGVVARTHPTSGRIVYKIQNGYEVEELHNVKITAPLLNNQVLRYTQSTGLWENKTLNFQTPLTLTTNGTSGAATLAGDGVLNIPNYSTAPGGSNTEVQFNNSGVFGGSSKFTWSNDILSLNTLTSPVSPILQLSSYFAGTGNTGKIGTRIYNVGQDLAPNRSMTTLNFDVASEPMTNWQTVMSLISEFDINDNLQNVTLSVNGGLSLTNIPLITTDATNILGVKTNGGLGKLSLDSSTLSLSSAGVLSGVIKTLNDLTDVVVSSPTSGQVLSYNGTNWVNSTGGGGGGGGTPAGNTGEIQFNNAGAFAADSDLIWNGTDLILGDATGNGATLSVFKLATGTPTQTRIALFNGYRAPNQGEATIEVGQNHPDGSTTRSLTVIGGSNISGVIGGFIETKNPTTRAISFNSIGAVKICGSQIGSFDYTGLSIGASTNIGTNVPTTEGVVFRTISGTMTSIGGNANNFNQSSFGQITVNRQVLSTTYTDASNVYISGPPIQGTATLTNRFSLFVASGNSYFAENIGVGQKIASARLHVRGSDDLSTSSAFLVQNNATTPANLLDIRNNGAIFIGKNNVTTTQNTASIQSAGADADISIAIVPKGTGAITADIPDGLVAGGNARGNNAVDLQMSRTANTHVASGNLSVICGGANNSAQSIYSIVLGGSGNLSSGARSITGGENCTASSSNAIALGNGCSASNTTSVAIGYSNASSGSNTLATGFNARSYLLSMRSHSGGNFSVSENASGAAQRSDIGAYRSITGTSAAELTLDGGTPAAGNRLILALPTGATSGRLWNAIVQLSAICTTAGGTVTVGEAFIGTYNLGIKRIGATTSLVGTAQNMITAQADTNMSSSVVTITADDTNESLKIDFTPPTGANASTVIRVVATVYLTEVGY